MEEKEQMQTAEAQQTEQPAAVAETVPAESAEPDMELAEFTEETEEQKKRIGKYRYTLSRQDMYEAMMNFEEAKGRHRMYKNISMVFLVVALIAAVQGILTQGIFYLLIALLMMVIALKIRGTDRSNAKRATYKMTDAGLKFSLELKKHGLFVSDMTTKSSIWPYSIFKAAYDYKGYLSLLTVKNTALHIKKDTGSASYCAIEKKFREELGEHYIVK